MYLFIYIYMYLYIYMYSPCSTKKIDKCWVPKANEIDTNNMKCTWPMQPPMRGDPTEPIFHLAALGSHWVCGHSLLGNFGVALGPQGFLDTNMLLSAKQNPRGLALIGGQARNEPPT